MTQLQLLNRIDVSVCGKGCHLRLGDINGDGRLEIVLLQPDSGFDERYFPHSVKCATAFNLEGEILWQVGTPDLETDFSTDCELPSQIFDIDNDGNNELLYIADGELIVLDGMNGTPKKKYPLPAPDAHDAIIIADLEGKGYPQNIILKNRFHQLWAMDSNFNVMWTYKGNIGHFPWPYDINGDGRDELICGYSVLGGEGEVLWTIPETSGHARYIWVGDLYQQGEDNRTIAVLGDRLTMLTTDGEVLWQTDVPCSDAAIGNILPSLHGAQVCLAGEGLAMLDCNGSFLASADTRSSRISTVHNIDKSGRDMLLCYNSSSPATLCDSELNPVYTFAYEDKIVWADLIGDGIADIILLTGDRIEIYSAVWKDLSVAAVPYARPQPKRLYNFTVHAGQTNPSQYALSYITGSFSENALAEWAAACVNATIPSDDEIISRADFTVLLINALGLAAYERDNFSDVYPTDYFWEAVGTAKKLGIAEGTLGRFNPRAVMTAEAAVDMIKKAGKDCFCMTEGELTKHSAAKI
ncbi:MAG: S-layer homology domain-containing protein, partial [Clostridia bacterium]|nr:S-layer homology domain-containing protein [Clostridia bacterium]